MMFDDLRAALDVLGLGQEASLQLVRDRYRELAKRHHPDHGADPDNERIRQVNEAYQLVSSYLQAYIYDFSRETFYRQYPEERLREQFYNTDLWGGQG